jgi:cardiolipin synthase C
MKFSLSHGLAMTGIALAVLTGAYFFLQYHYRLPETGTRQVTTHFTDTRDTRLGQQANLFAKAHPGRTGVYLLDDGRDAFAVRGGLARLAERSIDVQYYIFSQDTVGQLLTHELLRAADRGVRIRVLIDDMYGDEREDIWSALSGHPQIEVRLWNPWKRDRSRLLQSALRFTSINSRMHSKSFTIDGAITVLGGRNIADEYFDANTEVAFSDLDVVTMGPPVNGVSNQFDDYWNHEMSFPIESLITTEADLEPVRAELAAHQTRETTARYLAALAESSFAQRLLEGSLEFNWTEAHLIHDSPFKHETASEEDDSLLISQLAPYLSNARESINIVSPYFVPGKPATAVLNRKAAEGVAVSVLTNSLASNDVTAVHAGYAKYRRQLLRAGVRLFEFDESLKDREGLSFTWLPQLKKSSLHAKTMVFDGEWMFVGSFNFDARSLYLNNEIGLIFRDEVVAREAAAQFTANVNKVAFEVRFSREGGQQNMEWVGGQGGPDVVMTKEPYATTLQKALVGVLKWLPIEAQL